MNHAVVLRLLAYTLGALTIAFAGCIGVAFFADSPGDRAHTISGFASAAGITAALGGFLAYLGRRGSTRFFRKEALAVIGLTWILSSLIGSLPYLLIIPEIGFANAVFESTSGITTTGASVLEELETLPRSLLLWRALSQWMGGLGVVVFFVAILSSLGVGAKILFSRESTTRSNELDSTRIQQGVLEILYLYLGLSAACSFCLRLAGMEWFDAIAHTFTTISTGGYSTRSGSIADFENPTIEWVLITFMCLGGTSFLIMLRLARGNWRSLRQATEIKAYYAILAVGTLLAALVIDGRVFSGTERLGSGHDVFRIAAFQVASITTTTGFGTHDYETWAPAGSILMLILMMIGGCSGSTSGSTKVIRVVVAFRVIRLEIEKAFRARLVRPIRVNGQVLSEPVQNAAIVYIATIFLIAGVSFLIVGLLAPGLSILGILSSVISTLLNVGPGYAEVGPMENFGPLGSAPKFYLSFLMILGRIELFAVLVLFMPSFWKKY